MNRFLGNKETDALFALPEKGESEDDVDTLLRTTKRFIGNAKMIPPEHLSIQLLKMFRLSDDAEGKPSKSHREFVGSGWRM